MSNTNGSNPKTYTVVQSVEKRRGCGYRKPSKGGKGVGIYLVGGALSAPCGRLPWPLGVCPCCGGGIKPSRAWTWIEPKKLFEASARPCPVRDATCATCPLGLAMPEGRHGLLWIGEGFYASPSDYLREAREMGLSRKIPAIPKGFVLGETWVFLAHRFACAPDGAVDGEPTDRTPGVFAMFKPSGVDLVIDADEPPDRAKHLADQIGDGARIVKVIRDEDLQTALPFIEESKEMH